MITADEIVAERDLVVVRGTFRGVHRGAFAGMEATGNTASATLMIMYRIANGRIAQHWLPFDFPTRCVAVCRRRRESRSRRDRRGTDQGHRLRREW